MSVYKPVYTSVAAKIDFHPSSAYLTPQNPIFVRFQLAPTFHRMETRAKPIPDLDFFVVFVLRNVTPSSSSLSLVTSRPCLRLR